MTNRLLSALDASYGAATLAAALTEARTDVPPRMVTPMEIWTAIRESSRNDDPINAQHLIDQYRGTQLGKTGDIEKYVTRLQLLRAELSSLGEVYSDADFKYTLLSGLSPAYRTYEVILRADGTKTARDCIASLRAAGALIKRRNGASQPEVSGSDFGDTFQTWGLPASRSGRGHRRNRESASR